MKHILAPILLLVFLFPSLAMSEEVTFDDLVEREGVFYKKFTDIRFSGKVITGRKQGHIKNGKREGFWVEYYESGDLNSKGTYKDGNKEGPWIYYYGNGGLWRKGNFKDGEQEGPWVGYHPNGRLMYEGGVYKKGKQEGPWITYWENGQIVWKGEFRNGKQEGFWTRYHYDGTVDEENTGTYKNGVLVD